MTVAGIYDNGNTKKQIFNGICYICQEPIFSSLCFIDMINENIKEKSTAEVNKNAK